MKGELGPLAQAVAKYQLERKLQKELEKSRKIKGEKLINTVAVPGNDDKKVNCFSLSFIWRKAKIKCDDRFFIPSDRGQRVADKMEQGNS